MTWPRRCGGSAPLRDLMILLKYGRLGFTLATPAETQGEDKPQEHVRESALPPPPRRCSRTLPVGRPASATCTLQSQPPLTSWVLLTTSQEGGIKRETNSPPRSTCIESRAQAKGELQEGQRRVSDTMLRLRRKAEQQVLAQSNSCMCPISLALMREPVVAADGHTYERVEMKSGSG